MSRYHREEQRRGPSPRRGFIPGATWLILLAGLVLLAATASVGAAVTYENRTVEAGITFQNAGEVHEGPTATWPALPEILGGGACWADFDGDGYDDLYLVSQAYNPENPATEGWIDEVDPRNHLYINQGDGTFEERAEAAGVASRAFGYGCSAGDHDGDGDVDLYVTNFGMNELFENQGNATFVNITSEAGVGGQGLCSLTHRCQSTSSAWGDYDLDGDLDLYVGNYVDTNLTDGARGPANHDGQVNFLFRNDGDGTFTEVARDLGVAGNPTDLQGSKTLGVVWLDIDLDGDLDLYVANDERPNDFYLNHGDGTFTEKSDEAGLADDRAGMGVTAADYDRDGYPDLYFTHYDQEHNGFYRNLGDGTFEDRSGEDELADDFGRVGWGTHFLDYDRDGDLDILAVNGNTEWVAEDGQGGYRQETFLFRQDPSPDPDPAPGDVQWTNVSAEHGPGLLKEQVSRGAGFSDFDLDGDTDVAIVNNNNETAQLLVADGVEGNHLTIRLSQPGSNPQAIGARVTVEHAGTSQVLAVQAGSSYLSQNSLYLPFGLGEATKADAITVTWPDGATDTFLDVAAGQVLGIDRTTGLATDTIAPVTEVLDLDGAVAGWVNQPAQVDLSATDRGITETSGVAETSYRLGDGLWQAHDGEPFTLSEGLHRLQVASTDVAGNREPTSGHLVRVDLTDPTADHELHGVEGDQGWWINATVHLEAEDALSGVDRIEHRVNGGDWSTYEAPIELTDPGVHEVEYRPIDRAGNVGAVGSLQVPVDGTGPELSLVRPGAGSLHLGGETIAETGTGPAVVLAPPEATLTVVASASDTESGVDRVLFLVDDQVEHADRQGPDWSWTWPVSRWTPGEHRLQVIALDEAGNAATVGLDVVLVSATPPVLPTGPTAAPACASVLPPPLACPLADDGAGWRS